MSEMSEEDMRLTPKERKEAEVVVGRTALELVMKGNALLSMRATKKEDVDGNG